MRGLDLDAILDALADVIADKLAAKAAANAPAAEPLFMTAKAYALRTGFSARKIDALIREGLPCIGERSGRRVDVLRADEWMHGHTAVPTDDPAEMGRSDAKRKARAR